MIFGVVGVDAGEEIVVFCIVGVNLQLEVARVAEGSADDGASVLTALTVEREHHLSVVGMRVAGAVFVFDHLLTRQDRLFHETGLVGPGAVEMGEPHVAATDGQADGGELCQCDGLRLAVGDLRPGLDHIFVFVSLVAEGDRGRINRIFQCNPSNAVLLLQSSDKEFCGHIAVGVRHGDGGLSGTVHTVGGIGIHPAVAGGLQILEVEITQLLAEIHILWLFAVFYFEHHRRVFRLDGDLFCLSHL